MNKEQLEARESCIKAGVYAYSDAISDIAMSLIDKGEGWVGCPSHIQTCNLFRESLDDAILEYFSFFDVAGKPLVTTVIATKVYERLEEQERDILENEI